MHPSMCMRSTFKIDSHNLVVLMAVQLIAANMYGLSVEDKFQLELDRQLWTAIDIGRFDKVEALLKQGADPNYEFNNVSCVDLATRACSKSTLKRLLKRNADVDLGLLRLIHKYDGKDFVKLAELFVKYNAEVDHDKLSLAMSLDRLNMSKFLINSGAKYNEMAYHPVGTVKPFFFAFFSVSVGVDNNYIICKKAPTELQIYLMKKNLKPDEVCFRDKTFNELMTVSPHCKN